MCFLNWWIQCSPIEGMFCITICNSRLMCQLKCPNICRITVTKENTYYTLNIMSKYAHKYIHVNIYILYVSIHLNTHISIFLHVWTHMNVGTFCSKELLQPQPSRKNIWKKQAANLVRHLYLCAFTTISVFPVFF